MVPIPSHPVEPVPLSSFSGPISHDPQGLEEGCSSLAPAYSLQILHYCLEAISLVQLT